MKADRGFLAYLLAGIATGSIVGAGWWCLLFFLGDRLPLPEPIRGGLVGLSRGGRPFVTVMAFASVGAVLMTAGLSIYWLRLRAHDRSLAEQSELMGFRFQAEVSRDDLPDLPLFRDWSSAGNRMTGRHGNQPVEVLDYTSVAKGRGSDGEEYAIREDRTIVLVPAEGLPGFDLTPRNWLERALHPAKEWTTATDMPPINKSGDASIRDEVRRAYHLAEPGFSEDQTRFAADVFTPEVMELLTRMRGWTIKSRSGYLMLWRGRGFRPARERPELVSDALAIRDALTRAVAGGRDEA